MRTRFSPVTLLAIAGIASSGAAQQRPAVRQLGAVVAKSSDALSSIAGIRSLPNGTVLVNDVTARRLVLFNAGLTSSTLIADSTSATATAYAGRTGGLIPFRADSSIFVDPSSMSMLIVDGSGKIARVMSVPRTEDVQMLAGPLSTSVGFDPRGKLVYRGSPFGRGFFRGPGAGGPGAPGTAGGFPTPPDSLPIVRIDLATRKVDTIAYGKIPKIKINVEQSEGRIRVNTVANPLPTVDDFAMLPDGTVALVRGQDYHVDYYSTDGSKTSAPKIAFDWQRLKDEDKVAFIDSVKAARARAIAANPAAANGLPLGGGGGGGGGGPQIQIIGGPADAPRGGAGGAGGARGGAGGGGGFGANVSFVEPSELPDYKPAFFAGSTKVDTEGNLWVRTIPTKKLDGGPVYDVINRKGELVDRVQVPVSTTIVGFGADGTVYLNLSSNSTVYLEKAKVR